MTSTGNWIAGAAPPPPAAPAYVGRVARAISGMPVAGRNHAWCSQPRQSKLWADDAACVPSSKRIRRAASLQRATVSHRLGSGPA